LQQGLRVTTVNILQSGWRLVLTFCIGIVIIRLTKINTELFKGDN
jgi:hypothetical protein